MLLFERYVGRDELYYRLLERLDQAYFADENAGLGLQSAAHEKWDRAPQLPPRGRNRAIQEESWVFGLSAELSYPQVELATNQADISRRCDWFHHQYPYSPYTPNALFIKARAGDLRLDVQEFRKTRWVRVYDDFPNPASRQTWEIIAQNRPDSPMSAVVMLRISQLDAQNCEIDRALARILLLLAKFDRTVVTEPHYFADVDLFLDRPPIEAGLNIHKDQVLLKAAWLRDLLESNNNDDIYRSDPICGAHRGRPGTPFGLLDLDAREDGYGEQLQKLLAAFPNCKLSDNIQLELAKNISLPAERAKALSSVLERYPDGDATPEAMIRLAIALREDDEPNQADLILARLMNEHPSSIWARQCIELRLQTTPLQASTVNP